MGDGAKAAEGMPLLLEGGHPSRKRISTLRFEWPAHTCYYVCWSACVKNPAGIWALNISQVLLCLQSNPFAVVVINDALPNPTYESTHNAGLLWLSEKVVQNTLCEHSEDFCGRYL